MDITEWYLRQAEEYFSRYAIALEDYFQDTKDKLKKADIGYTLMQYLSMALLSSVIVFVCSAPVLSILIGLWASGVAGIAAGLIVGLVGGIFLGITTFAVFYIYPSIQVSSRRENIDHNLPFATTYLSTVAGSGTPPAAMFKLLGSFEEYGSVSEEAKKIANDIYSFGADVDAALDRAAERTPSENFKELLWGINSVVSTGGDLKGFLEEKADQYMTEYRRELDSFTETLSLLVEMYITIVIVGSVFLVIISTIMSALGTGKIVILALQVSTVFILLPLASIMFIVIIKAVSPIE